MGCKKKRKSEGRGLGEVAICTRGEGAMEDAR